MELVVHILAPLAFLMNILFQIFLVRYQKSSLLKSELAAFIFGFISLVVMSILFWQPHQPLANTLYFVLNTLIYTCLGYVFFHFINLGETGRRVRILREIVNNGNQMRLDELQTRYNAENMVNYRFDRLIHNRQIYLDNGVLKANAGSVLAMHVILRVCRRLILREQYSPDTKYYNSRFSEAIK